VLKHETGTKIAGVLNDIITSSSRRPIHVWCDKGTEFYDKHVKKLVDLISTENEEKFLLLSVGIGL
jgi:hypothetical protein